MNKQTNTRKPCHQAFHDYLMEKFDGDTQEVDLFVETAERIVPNMLNNYFGKEIASIYDMIDTDDIEEYRKKIKADTVLKNLDMKAEPRFTEVLKWYRLFVKAMNSNVLPMPVPGEYDSGETVDSEPPSTTKPIVETTIYMEGSEGESQPQELRKRNMALRQACINYYKSLHGGRIVCECCGFDFTKAYDIDDEYIEVHHRFPFSQTEGEHPVNSQTDLVPLCANCHRMIHHAQGGKGNCLSLEELKKIYKGIHYKNE